ncbi:MAG: ATP-grasp domain-containing protein [Bacteroidales bacterium]|nr:ATP-grasp domain-containing protein [Bacteroidales bacterium]
MEKALILINKMSSDPAEDELDVLEQARVVEEALLENGYQVHREFLDLDLLTARTAIMSFHPDLIFNLVESLDGKGELVFLPTALLESLDIPYTGCQLDSMYLTSNKVLAKKKLIQKGLPTADWYTSAQASMIPPDKRYIIKPVWEDASVDIDDHVVFTGSDPGLKEYFIRNPLKKAFIEEYIEGREFNISILGGENGPEVLPPAEIRFMNFPEGKPRIVGYRSKWKEDSFEYRNTIRSFDFPVEDRDLLARLKALCLSCWKEFNLRGYARVDFRVDGKGHPFILEINANPCISPDAGFYAACQTAGYPFSDVILRIIYDAFH